MGSSRSVRSAGLALWLAVVLTAALAGQAWSQGPGYGSPTWAPDWFKYCTNPKQWVQWTLPNQIMEWGFNYTPPPAMPTLTLGTDSLSVWMDNIPARDYYKQVWVEILYSYSGKVPNFSSPTQPLLEWSGGWTKLLEQGNPVGPGLPFGWYNEELGSGKGRFTAYYEIVPQPDWERFTLSWSVGNPSFSTVRMLTQCNPIPEPMSMVLAGLGLGAVGALRRRR
jgi:hypothetical protein